MHDEGTDSHIKIFANIFISFIGAGILGLPYAFKEVGKPFSVTRSVCQVIALSLSPQSGIVEGTVVMSIVGAVRYIHTLYSSHVSCCPSVCCVQHKGHVSAN